jgi:hypothetical protein
VVVQATTALAGPCTGGTLCVANVGNAGVHNAHAPAFNDSYFSSAISPSWLLYMGGFTGATNQTLTLYGIGFGAGYVMSNGTPSTISLSTVNPGEYAPMTEFNNGATDWLFVGILESTSPNVGSLTINSFPGALTHSRIEGSGPSGMTIDNSSGSKQASSIYFGTQAANTAVKLTQAGLQ